MIEGVKLAISVGVPSLTVLASILINERKLSDLRRSMDRRFDELIRSVDARFDGHDQKLDRAEQRLG